MDTHCHLHLPHSSRKPRCRSGFTAPHRTSHMHHKPMCICTLLCMHILTCVYAHVCMCAYIPCVYMYSCSLPHMHVPHMHLPHVYTHIWVPTHMHSFTHIYVPTYLCVPTHIPVCAFIPHMHHTYTMHPLCMYLTHMHELMYKYACTPHGPTCTYTHVVPHNPYSCTLIHIPPHTATHIPTDTHSSMHTAYIHPRAPHPSPHYRGGGRLFSRDLPWSLYLHHTRIIGGHRTYLDIHSHKHTQVFLHKCTHQHTDSWTHTQYIKCRSM